MHLALKIVTLDNFCRNIRQSAVREIFPNILDMRMQGWGPEYPEYYLPMDSIDYVGRHHLFCIEENKTLIPVSGFRQISLAHCDFYRIAEPHLGLVEKAQSRPHIDAVKKLFDEHRSQGKTLLSGSKVTTAKAYRGNKEFSESIRELIAALLYSDMLELSGSTQIGSGVFRFKTDRFLSHMGFSPLEHDGAPLSPIAIPEAGSEPIVIMQTQTFSPWVRECFEKHRDQLKTRVRYDGESLARSEAA